MDDLWQNLENSEWNFKQEQQQVVDRVRRCSQMPSILGAQEAKGVVLPKRCLPCQPVPGCGGQVLLWGAFTWNSALDIATQSKQFLLTRYSGHHQMTR